mmetsp:Transcript_8969/g.18559  ORF Transcript_8969/g.18559 Transcript_8969/m.18559 type:complete len:155 (+) Transcript_8969:88-552(+)
MMIGASILAASAFLALTPAPFTGVQAERDADVNFHVHMKTTTEEPPAELEEEDIGTARDFAEKLMLKDITRGVLAQQTWKFKTNDLELTKKVKGPLEQLKAWLNKWAPTGLQMAKVEFEKGIVSFTGKPNKGNRASLYLTFRNKHISEVQLTVP